MWLSALLCGLFEGALALQPSMAEHQEVVTLVSCKRGCALYTVKPLLLGEVFLVELSWFGVSTG